MLGLGLVLGLFSALLDMVRTRSPMLDRLQRRNNSQGHNCLPHLKYVAALPCEMQLSFTGSKFCRFVQNGWFAKCCRHSGNSGMHVCEFACAHLNMQPHYSVIKSNKKLSYRQGTARCVLSVVILPITTQQCRNYLYDKS